jgi:hypothetical protein
MDMDKDEQIQDLSGYRPGAVAAGVILLGLGAAMFLDTTGAMHIHLGRVIGPLVLITIGMSMTLGTGGFVFERRRGRMDRDMRRLHLRRRGGPTTGIWLIGVGAWMLASQTGLFGLAFHNSWPLLIVLGGIMMVIRGFK